MNGVVFVRRRDRFFVGRKREIGNDAFAALEHGAHRRLRGFRRSAFRHRFKIEKQRAVAARVADDASERRQPARAELVHEGMDGRLLRQV